MELPITANGVAYAAFRFRERRRVENDKVKLRSGFLCGAQIWKDILFDPARRKLIVFRIFARGREGVRLHLDTDYIGRARPGTSQRECSLVGKAIENASTCRQLRYRRIMRKLVEIKSGLLRAQRIDQKFHPTDFEFVLPSLAPQHPAIGCKPSARRTAASLRSMIFPGSRASWIASTNISRR